MRIPRWLWALFLISLTAPFWRLSMPLIEVDDARYAAIPREMLLSHDWATPHLDGMDYVEKPPLLYWLVASSYKIFDVSEATARIPLALLSLLGLLLTAWLGSWLYSPQTGVSAAILLSVTALYFFHSHYMTLDMGLTVWLLGSSAFILRALLRPEDRSWAGPLAWTCAALAFLSKGLVALIFPMGWTLALIIPYPALRKGFWGLLNPIGPLIFTALVLPWFALMEHRHPGFFHFFFVEQHFQRYFTTAFHRGQPWYFFLLVVPVGLLPAAPAVFAGLPKALGSWRQDPKATALWLWVIMIVAFFSVSHSKLVTYVLPTFPQLAVLGALALENPMPSWVKRSSLILGLILATAAIATPFIRQPLALPSDLSPLAVELALVSIATLGFTLIIFAKLKLPPILALGTGGLLFSAITLSAVNAASSITSVRDLSREISAHYQAGDQIYVYGVYLHGLPFYTGHSVDRILNWTGELQYAKRNPDNAGRFGDIGEISTLPPHGRHVFLAFRRFETPFVASLVQADKVKFQNFGPWELAEF